MVHIASFRPWAMPWHIATLLLDGGPDPCVVGGKAAVAVWMPYNCCSGCVRTALLQLRDSPTQSERSSGRSSSSANASSLK